MPSLSRLIQLGSEGPASRPTPKNPNPPPIPLIRRSLFPGVCTTSLPSDASASTIPKETELTETRARTASSPSSAFPSLPPHRGHDAQPKKAEQRFRNSFLRLSDERVQSTLTQGRLVSLGRLQEGARMWMLRTMWDTGVSTAARQGRASPSQAGPGVECPAARQSARPAACWHPGGRAGFVPASGANPRVPGVRARAPERAEPIRRSHPDLLWDLRRPGPERGGGRRSDT